MATGSRLRGRSRFGAVEARNRSRHALAKPMSCSSVP